MRARAGTVFGRCVCGVWGVNLWAARGVAQRGTAWRGRAELQACRQRPPCAPWAGPPVAMAVSGARVAWLVGGAMGGWVGVHWAAAGPSAEVHAHRLAPEHPERAQAEWVLYPNMTVSRILFCERSDPSVCRQLDSLTARPQPDMAVVSERGGGPRGPAQEGLSTHLAGGHSYSGAVATLLHLLRAFPGGVTSPIIDTHLQTTAVGAGAGRSEVRMVLFCCARTEASCASCPPHLA